MNTCLIVGFVLILINCLPTANRALGEKTLTKATNFDDYEAILQQTLDFKQKLRLIEAIWAEIRHDYGDDLDKAGKLYHQLDYTIEAFLAAQNQLQAAKELKQELRLHLQSKNAEILAKSWTGFKAHAPNEQLQIYLGQMLLNFETILMAQIYKSAIDLSYGAIAAQDLSAHVRHTLIKNDDKSFEVVLEAQIYLFGKFVITGDVSDEFFFDIAYYLHKMQRHYFFKYLKTNLKRRFWLVIDELPKTLKQLFFANEFCLLNKNYNEFLYTTNATKIDDERNYIFTWGTPAAVNELGVWLMNITEIGNAYELKLKFSFSSKYLGAFMYLEPQLRDYEFIVVAWRGANSTPANNFWSLHLSNDVLIIENEQKLLCASEEFFDGRRFVYGRWNAKYNPGTENCQWQATVCP